MLPPRSNKLIMHLDMNSFFASVEQQANPTLRGKPLGVCAYHHRYSTVIAASIEAKRIGMKVGMKVDDARKKFPGAVFVVNDPPKYRLVASKVFGMLHELTDHVEHYSIDEAFADFTGWYRDPAELSWELTKLRRRIQHEVGDWLRCSIGIAPTRFLAKTASDLEKPNGLVVITYENLDEILGKMDLEDVCGIGPRTRKRLERLGIRTLLEVKRYPVGNLMRAFGKGGLFLWCRLHGLEFERVEDDTEEEAPKSVGHSYWVPDRVNRAGKVWPVLMKLTERAGRRLRKLGLLAGTMSVSVGFRGEGFATPQGPFWQPVQGQGGSTWKRWAEPASDPFTLVQTASELLHDIWEGEPLNFLAVTLGELSTPSVQRRLDETHESWRREDDRRERASRAMDIIRDKYGEWAIVFGEMLQLEDEAPDRIGFRKTEGVDVVRERAHDTQELSVYFD
jgi:DNA polymerase IV